MNNKKKVLVTAVAVCLIAILSFSTLAWFTDTDRVDNYFQVATSTETADDIFSVDVWEIVEDSDGNEFRDEDGHSYTDILPGENLTKKVYIQNTSKENSQYIKATITVTNATALNTALGQYGYVIDDLFVTIDTTNSWELVEAGSITNDVYTVEYYLNTQLIAQNNALLFESIQIPKELDQENMANLDAFEIDVVATAIQTENLGEGVDTAREAFAVVNP